MKRLLLLDYSEEQLFLAIEVGIQSAPGITGILRDLLRHSAAKPVTQKVPASYGDQSGTSLCSALLAGEPLSWFCAIQRHIESSASPESLLQRFINSSKTRKTRPRTARMSGSKLCQLDSDHNEHTAS